MCYSGTLLLWVVHVQIYQESVTVSGSFGHHATDVSTNGCADELLAAMREGRANDKLQALWAQVTEEVHAKIKVLGMTSQFPELYIPLVSLLT